MGNTKNDLNHFDRDDLSRERNTLGGHLLEKNLDLKPTNNEGLNSQNIIREFTKEEIAKAIIRKLPREQLKGQEAEKDLMDEISEKSYLSKGTNTVHMYQDKIIDRTLTEKDYNKITKEIIQHNSILPIGNIRDFSYGGGGGDVILSETTGKMYCVDNHSDCEELIKDYNGKQYYTSRSGASGAGIIKAGKKTLIYLPTTRIDVAYPGESGTFTSVNGVDITAWSDRGIVDTDYPVTIQPNKKEKQEGGYEFVFIDTKNVNDTISIIKAGGENSKYPKNYKIFEEFLGSYYIDESGEKEEEVTIKYLSDRKINKKILRDILNYTNNVVQFTGELDDIESEFDRIIGIAKTKRGNYVVKNRFGQGIKRYGNTHPRKTQVDTTKLFDYVITGGNRIEKEFYDDLDNTKVDNNITKGHIRLEGDIF